MSGPPAATGQVHRTFEVGRPRAEVWDRLARPASWPSWARHVRAVDVGPPGLLGPSSAGVVRLANGVRSRFVVTSFVTGERWLWSGKFLWLRVDYDHVLEAVAADRTRVTFDVRVTGFAVGTLGRLFARIYGKNLDAAIPRLVAEYEGRDT
jgi:hypothetical protein